MSKQGVVKENFIKVVSNVDDHIAETFCYQSEMKKRDGEGEVEYSKRLKYERAIFFKAVNIVVEKALNEYEQWATLEVFAGENKIASFERNGDKVEHEGVLYGKVATKLIVSKIINFLASEMVKELDQKFD